MTRNAYGSFGTFLAGAAPKGQHQDPPDAIARMARKGTMSPGGLSLPEIKTVCDWVASQVH